MRIDGATVRAVDELTRRWALETQPAARRPEAPGEALGEGPGKEPGEGPSSDAGTVFSAAGVWPLLALLADGAGGPARAELADAVGLPADEAGAAARELLAVLDEAPGLSAAFGLWPRHDLRLQDDWLARLPEGSYGVLTGDTGTDRAALDAWASRRTGGEIDRMPVEVDRGTRMVLATALTLRTKWYRPFDDSFVCPESGPWRGRSLPGLHRSTTVLDRLAVADTPDGTVTALTVMGTVGIDVQLVLGEEEMTPSRAIGGWLRAASGGRGVVPGSRLPYGRPGPGIEVTRDLAVEPAPPTLHVRTVPFTVTAEHDLLRHHELFGLTSAGDRNRGHFPGISGSFPLAVEQAAQAATATFSAVGFKAGAVTAVAVTAGGVPRLRYRTTRLYADFDRPFGFLAVHRRTGLVLAAGRVDDVRNTE